MKLDRTTFILAIKSFTNKEWNGRTSECSLNHLQSLWWPFYGKSTLKFVISALSIRTVLFSLDTLSICCSILFPSSFNASASVPEDMNNKCFTLGPCHRISIFLKMLFNLPQSSKVTWKTSARNSLSLQLYISNLLWDFVGFNISMYLMNGKLLIVGGALDIYNRLLIKMNDKGKLETKVRRPIDRVKRSHLREKKRSEGDGDIYWCSPSGWV